MFAFFLKKNFDNLEAEKKKNAIYSMSNPCNADAVVNKLTVKKELKVCGDVSVKGNERICGNLTVKGDINLEGDINRNYDYIIVGFGTTACIVARKLIDAGKSVLVLERGKNNFQKNGIPNMAVQSPSAGGNAPVAIYNNPELSQDIPFGVGFSMKANISSQPGQLYRAMTEGNGWGGGGSHYFMNAFRGSDYVWNEYDSISGNTGKWTFDTILPLLKGMESYIQRTPSNTPGGTGNNPGSVQSDRGQTGPMTIVQMDDWNAIQGSSFLQQFANNATVGLGWSPDLNSSLGATGITGPFSQSTSGRNPVGVGFRQMANILPLKTFGGANRSSTLLAFMPVGEVIDENGNGLGNFDVKVYSNVLANRVIFDGTKAVGVEYLREFDKYSSSTITTAPITFPVVTQPILTVLSVSRIAATIAEATTSVPHGYASGLSVVVGGITPIPPSTTQAYNGIFTITVTAVDKFTYTVPSDIVPSTSGAGYVTPAISINVADTSTFPTSGKVIINGTHYGSFGGKTATTLRGFIDDAGQTGTLPIGSTVECPYTTVTTSPINFPILSTPLLIISSAVRTSATIAVITTAVPHGYSNGQTVVIGEITVASYNGVFIISNVTATTFEITVVSGTVPSASGPGFVTTSVTINVVNTDNFPTTGRLVINEFFSCSYAGKTSTSFIGCIGNPSQAGVISAGAKIGRTSTVGTNSLPTLTIQSLGLIRPFNDLLPSDYKVVYGKNIILCAGANNTPQILQRSGVGNSTLLNSLSIPVVVNSTQVGQNLTSHYNLGYFGFTGSATPLNVPSGSAAFGFNLHGVDIPGGPYYYPDDNIRRFQGAAGNSFTPSTGISTNMYNPLSKGFINITSKNPISTPDVDLRLFTDAGSLTNPPGNGSDMSRCIAYIKVLQKITADSGGTLVLPINPLNPPASPGNLSTATPALTQTFINTMKNNVNIQTHSAGTCKMGTSIANGVVDVDLKVFGTQNLYCADLSVVPFANDGNPNNLLNVVGLRLIQSLGLPTLPAI